MTTLGPVSKLPPRKPGFCIFRGERHIRNAIYERLAEPVELVEVWRKGQAELGVKMTGRQQAFPLSAFTGTWTPLEIEEIP